jgi:hypothetical protein
VLSITQAICGFVLAFLIGGLVGYAIIEDLKRWEDENMHEDN